MGARPIMAILPLQAHACADTTIYRYVIWLGCSAAGEV